MADIKFHCPECKQRIGADETVAGLSLDCPICRSTLRIPESGTAPVQVLMRRRLAVSGGTSYEDYDRKQKELADALKDVDLLRAQNAALAADLTKARLEAATAAEESRILDRSATETKLKLSELRNETLVLRAEVKETREQVIKLDAGRAAATKQLASAQRELEQAQAANSELSAALEQAAAIRRGCDELRAALERTQNRSEPTPTTSRPALHWQNAATAAEERAELLRKELDAVRAELAELQESHSKAENAAQELATLREQLTAIEEDRARSRTSATVAEAETLRVREELEGTKVQLKEQLTKAEEISARLRETEQERSALVRQLEDQTAAQSLLQERERVANDELERVRAMLSVSNAERDEARAEIVKREEGLNAAAERTSAAETEALRALEELEGTKVQLKEQLARAEEISARLRETEQERSALVRQIEDQTAAQSLLQEREGVAKHDELERVRAMLSVATAERDEARAEIAKRDEALNAAAESANQKESALRMTQTKMEALVRTVKEVAAQSEADRGRRAMSRTAELEHRAGIEERRRQIEAELAKASELLRSAKATRFKLRERLAAGETREGESSDLPRTEAVAASKGVTELHKALEQLHPVVEAARKHFEVLHAELHTMDTEEQAKSGDVGVGDENSRSNAEEGTGQGGGAEVPVPQTLTR